MELGQQLGGHIGDPPGDRGERSHPGQDRRRAQRQHDRDGVVSALIRKSSRGRAQVTPSGAERAVPKVYSVSGCGWVRWLISSKSGS